jgi:hypothetical protein
MPVALFFAIVLFLILFFALLKEAGVIRSLIAGGIAFIVSFTFLFCQAEGRLPFTSGKSSSPTENSSPYNQSLSDKDLFDQYYVAKMAKTTDFDNAYSGINRYVKNGDLIGAIAEAKDAELQLFRLSESLKDVPTPKLKDASLSDNLAKADEMLNNTYTLKWQTVSKLLKWSKEPSPDKMADMRKDSDLSYQGLITSTAMLMDIGTKLGSSQLNMDDKKLKK